jgi:polyisoprenoid-binding protein YceI
VAVAIQTRTVEGVELPAAGTWHIDASHSGVSFSARHLMVAKVRGRFGSFQGAVNIGDVADDSSVAVTIDAASIDTRDEKRDAHLRSGDFLDVENHPTLSFTSTGFTRTGESTFQLPGDLSIRGVTKPVVLDVDYEGTTLDPWGNTRAVFSARTQIDREDWGLTWNVALETGGVLVGKIITIELEVEAVKSNG